MKKNKVLLMGVIFITIFMIVSCGPSTRTVTRVSVDEVQDLSGRWNDTDSRLVAEQMIRGLISRSWINDFVMDYDRKPVVVVGAVRNLSSEHIQTGTFVKDIEREFINSGKVKFVATSEERKEVREERLEQQSYASDETAKRLAAETGADFMLKGSIKTHIDAIEGKQIKFYQVDMELINVETNEKVWMDSKKIKKFVKQKKAKW